MHDLNCCCLFEVFVRVSMRIVFWNVRGLGTEVKIAMVRRLVSKHRVDVCFLQESKLEIVSGDFIRRIWEMTILIIDMRLL